METNFNFKSQPCSSREQSKKLLALGLKPETADMHYSTDHRGNVRQLWLLAYGDLHEDVQVHSLPAWSLHRLLCMLPRCVEGGYHLAISYDHIEYRTTYNEVTTWWRGGNTYDMIIETIDWLIKEGYFNKEYLV